MLHLFITLGLLALTSRSGWATELVTRTAVDLKVGTNAVMAVDVFKPLAGKAKALIISLPGSDGFGHEYDKGSPQQDSKLPGMMMQRIELFAKAGYATAIYSQRGLQRPSECAKGETAKEKNEFYGKHCYDKQVRSQVDLDTITADTRKVFAHFSTHPITKDLPVIALGLSEGSYHVARLIDLQRIKPAGVVFIGGMFGSFAATLARQFRKEFYFEKFDITFKVTGKEQISFADVVTYADVNFWLGHPNYPPWGIGAAMGNVVISKEGMRKQKQVFEESYQQLFTTYSPGSPQKTLVGGVYGLTWPDFISGKYWEQSMRSNKSIIDQLKNYPHEVRFLFGAADDLVKIPPVTACDNIQPKCKITLIFDAGHQLEEQSGLLPERSLNAILNAINEVAAPLK